MPEFRVRQLFAFMKAFGLPRGARLWASMKLQLLRGDTLSLQVPGVAQPLHLRREDLPIFDQILVDQEDDLGPYVQAGRVEEMYWRLLADGKKPLILDCGGHVGFSAVWFAERFPEAVIYSIEPQAKNFRVLQANAAAYSNIVPVRGGVWSHRCQLRITNPDAVSAAFRVEEITGDLDEDSPEVVPAYTIEEFLHNDENSRLLLVKIDIEGAEEEVFRGPAAWLAQAAAVLIELHDWMLPGQRTSRNFLDRVAAHSFEIVPRGEKLLLFRTEPREWDMSAQSATWKAQLVERSERAAHAARQ